MARIDADLSGHRTRTNVRPLSLTKPPVSPVSEATGTPATLTSVRIG